MSRRPKALGQGLRLHGASGRRLTGPVPPGCGAGRAPQRQPGLLPQRSAVPGGPWLRLQPGPGSLQAGRHGRGGHGALAGTWGDWLSFGGRGGGWAAPCDSPANPSPAGGHTAAVGPQPGSAADPAHGLYSHPLQPRALRDPQPPLLPSVAPGLTLALGVLHHLPGGLAPLLPPLLDPFTGL